MFHFRFLTCEAQFTKTQDEVVGQQTQTSGRTMKIPFKINDDIIISNNDKDNDVSNGCLINTGAKQRCREYNT